MQTAPPVLPLLLALLSISGWTNGLCNLENGTVAQCHELEDVKYIETYDLESLKASVMQKVLEPGLFANLSSLKHLDLSSGDLEHVEPGSFRKLVNLRSLDLADNHIGYLELSALDGLNHLRSLNLRKNNLRQLPPALARLKILRHLDVQGNPLECNCATLRVRDLIVKRGVKISKKILCVGPGTMKGTPLLTPDATTICTLEEQDREMQKDQPYEGSGTGIEPEDPLDELEEEEEEEDVKDDSVGGAKEVEIETPYPDTVEVSTSSNSAAVTDNTLQEGTSATKVLASSTTVSDSLEKATDDDDEIFFDNDDKKDQTSTEAQSTEKKEIKDALFYPVEGSGDDEGSGEGSGTGIIFSEIPVETTDKKEETTTSSSGDSILDTIFSVLWGTTATPEDKKEPDLEEEQFIDVSSSKDDEEELIVPHRSHVEEAMPTTVEVTTRDNLFSPTSGIELVDTHGVHDTSKMGNVKITEESVNDELAEVSPARQSKKGMGSYVVLAALLAVLAALIGFAAYKGDFCRKKRKRGDVENGTEMKDMQKALLDGNAPQPKIASNGNAESVPLVDGPPEQEDGKHRAGHQTALDGEKPPNGTSDHADPVKPPRRAVSSQDERKDDEKPCRDSNSLRDDSLSARTGSMDPVATTATNNGPVTRLPEINGPPVSPAAQRVKITLQENPDSVPKTPILITRTMAGENLVKSTP